MHLPAFSIIIFTHFYKNFTVILQINGSKNKRIITFYTILKQLTKIKTFLIVFTDVLFRVKIMQFKIIHNAYYLDVSEPK